MEKLTGTTGTKRASSGPNLARAADDIAEGGELLRPDGAARMDAAGGDADFRAKPELAAVAELRGGVPHSDRAAEPAQEIVRHRLVLGDDGVGMPAAMGGDMGEGFVRPVDDG